MIEAKIRSFSMRNIKLFAVLIIALVTGIVLAGCASMQLVSLETDTVDGPKQVRQGQDINPREVTVWGIYKDGSRKVVSVGTRDITFNKHTPGLQTVKVRVGVFTSQEVSFQTEVMALRTLTVASQPRVALFKVGDEPDPTWPGLEIRGEWNQMGSDKINLASCEITGYIKEQSGKQTIKVTYEGITTTFDIDVRGMTSLQISQPPTKLDYFQGDALDLGGLRVMGVWEGFPAEPLTITKDDVTGFNTNNVGIQHVTVTKNGKNAIFDVEVMALTSIELDKPPTKTSYKVGEPLDLTGILVYGNYTGANPNKKKRELIPEDQLTVSGYEANRIGTQQRVTVTVKGQNANFFVDVLLQ
jgi:hypothetical protein